MSEIDTELASRLVTGRKRDGRCTYDPQAKAEIVEQCLQPGASVARIGMQYGINANLLRTWMGKRHVSAQAKTALAVKRAPAEVQFVALQIEAPKAQPAVIQAVPARLHVRLPNGVAFDLSETSLEALSTVIGILGAVACSSSTSH
jgi:transposase